MPAPIGAWESLPLPKLSATCRCTILCLRARHISKMSMPATAQWLVSITTWSKASMSSVVITLENERPATGNRFSMPKVTPDASSMGRISSSRKRRDRRSQRNGAWATMTSAPTAAAISIDVAALPAYAVPSTLRSSRRKGPWIAGTDRPACSAHATMRSGSWVSVFWPTITSTALYPASAMASMT